MRANWARPTRAKVAKAEVSTNAGTSWDTLWSLAGSGGAGQGGFGLVTVSLAAYANVPLKVRFRYDYVSGSYYNTTGTNPPVGWFIDDIQIGENFIKRLYLGTGEPTATEIQILEFMNRARADAVAEDTRLRTSTDPDVVAATTFFGVNFTTMTAQFAAGHECEAAGCGAPAQPGHVQQRLPKSCFLGQPDTAEPVSSSAPAPTERTWSAHCSSPTISARRQAAASPSSPA
ncbi:MAG: hypothetical protein ACOYOL_09185 [Chthoniobacterales bacterium]